MDTFSLLFEFVPVVLAIVAIPQLAIAIIKHKTNRTVMSMALVACILLIIAQTGFIQGYLTNHPQIMSLFDKIWTVFNTLVVASYLVCISNTRSS